MSFIVSSGCAHRVESQLQRTTAVRPSSPLLGWQAPWHCHPRLAEDGGSRLGSAFRHCAPPRLAIVRGPHRIRSRDLPKADDARVMTPTPTSTTTLTPKATSLIDKPTGHSARPHRMSRAVPWPDRRLSKFQLRQPEKVQVSLTALPAALAAGLRRITWDRCHCGYLPCQCAYRPCRCACRQCPCEYRQCPCGYRRCPCGHSCC